MRYWVETLGCPKNQVDSDKLVGTLVADGYGPASGPGQADLIVVNTCAFIEAARQESIDTILELSERRPLGSRLVVTGCMAERYGAELADALPEVDLVAGFGVSLTSAHHAGHQVDLLDLDLDADVDDRRGALPASHGDSTPVMLGRKPAARAVPSFDLLNLPRPPIRAPWAYVKVAEGCDRSCGFCAIPSFRGQQRSRAMADVLSEIEALDAAEIVLVAQDLASYGRDLGQRGAIVDLVRAVIELGVRTRLLYLYPSELTESLIEVMGETSCHYFDLSLQHASKVHLRRMRRWGDGPRFLERIARIRHLYPDAAFRSSFIVGYPGETEDDHDALISFLEQAELDWAGFFPFSPEDGTYAVGLAGRIDQSLVGERLAECSELQDRITARRRSALIGTSVRVLVDVPGVARSHREAPEIDGVIRVDAALAVGRFLDVEITGAEGPDLDAVPVAVAVG